MNLNSCVTINIQQSIDVKCFKCRENPDSSNKTDTAKIMEAQVVPDISSSWHRCELIAICLVLWEKLAVTTSLAVQVLKFGSYLLPELLMI